MAEVFWHYPFAGRAARVFQTPCNGRPEIWTSRGPASGLVLLFVITVTCFSWSLSSRFHLSWGDFRL